MRVFMIVYVFVILLIAHGLVLTVNAAAAFGK